MEVFGVQACLAGRLAYRSLEDLCCVYVLSPHQIGPGLLCRFCMLLCVTVTFPYEMQFLYWSWSCKAY